MVLVTWCIPKTNFLIKKQDWIFTFEATTEMWPQGPEAGKRIPPFHLIDKPQNYFWFFKKHIYGEGGHRILFPLIHEYMTFTLSSYVGGVIPNVLTDYRRRIKFTHSRTIFTIIRSSVGVAWWVHIFTRRRQIFNKKLQICSGPSPPTKLRIRAHMLLMCKLNMASEYVCVLPLKMKNYMNCWYW